jgi:hypothetical protein
LHRNPQARLIRKIKCQRKRFEYRYRWLVAIKLRDDGGAMSVNWLMIEIVNTVIYPG